MTTAAASSCSTHSTSAINIRNNMIVDNGAADLGGAMLIDDASKVAIINNTLANNVSTGSSEDSDGIPHSAGLATEANDPLWQSDGRYTAQYPNAATRPDFSNPVALFNNIFWNNDAFTLDQPGPGADAGQTRASSTSRSTARQRSGYLYPALLRSDQRPDPRRRTAQAARC